MKKSRILPTFYRLKTHALKRKKGSFTISLAFFQIIVCVCMSFEKSILWLALWTRSFLRFLVQASFSLLLFDVCTFFFRNAMSKSAHTKRAREWTVSGTFFSSILVADQLKNEHKRTHATQPKNELFAILLSSSLSASLPFNESCLLLVL